ncbi:MAG: hypothetical protein H8E27_07935 [Verrucomicrobia subdivision 3 bacterium]|nr:hypothetical protein [Limisphaerales bacterium]
MSVESVKDWLRPRVRRGWLAVDRWLMPDVAAELAGLEWESPRLRRRLKKRARRVWRAKLQTVEKNGHKS